jgi:hypothetical protein
LNTRSLLFSSCQASWRSSRRPCCCAKRWLFLTATNCRSVFLYLTGSWERLQAAWLPGMLSGARSFVRKLLCGSRPLYSFFTVCHTKLRVWTAALPGEGISFGYAGHSGCFLQGPSHSFSFKETVLTAGHSHASGPDTRCVIVTAQRTDRSPWGIGTILIPAGGLDTTILAILGLKTASCCRWVVSPQSPESSSEHHISL